MINILQALLGTLAIILILVLFLAINLLASTLARLINLFTH